jgi:hypothetical protein
MWWDERSGAAAPCFVAALPEPLLVRILSLLAPSPPDVAAAAGACRAFRDALRAAALCSREWACAACGAAAFASDALQPQHGARWAFLEDGPALAVDTAAPSCALVRNGTIAVEARNFEARATGIAHGWPVPFAQTYTTDDLVSKALSCAGCGLYLGARCQQADRAWAAVCEAYLVRRLRSGAADPAPPPPRREPRELRCAGARCGALLALHEAVLSKNHTWTLPGLLPGDGPTWHDAWVLNNVQPGALVASNARDEELAQGDFEVEDVACAACGAQCGWRFGEHRWRASVSYANHNVRLWA